MSGKCIECRKGDLDHSLEVWYQNGKYVLHSDDANYSFDTLHTVFRKVFRQTALRELSIDSALILGYGAGSVATLLRVDYEMNGRVVGIEKDNQVLALADKYFKSTYLEDVDVLAMDAAEYMHDRKESFDLVVCDVFVNKEVPESVQTASFVNSLIEATNPGGIGYFNFIAETATQKGRFDRLVKYFDTLAVSFTILKISSINHILVWRKPGR